MAFVEPKRSKAVYPTGLAPSVNFAHPASKGLLLSAVASAGPNFVNLLTGTPGTPNGGANAPSFSMQEASGPNNYFQNNGNVAFPYLNTAWTAQTMAAIVTFDSATSASVRNILSSSAAGTAGFLIACNTGGGGTSWAYQLAGSFISWSAGTDLGQSPVAGATYFYAVSVANGEPANGVLRRLDTGKITVTQTANAASFTAGDTTIAIGNRGTNSRQTIGKIAAVMHSNNYMSMAQLAAWAEDPWSFWYPQQQPRTNFQDYANLESSGVFNLPSVLRQQRSKLAYPSGVVPGIDPSHVASRGILISTVARDGNHHDLITGKVATIAGTPTSKIDGLIGDSVNFPGNTDRCNFASFPTTAFAESTVACIFKMYTAPSAPVDAVGHSNGSNIGHGIGSTNGLSFTARWGGNFVTFTSIPIAIVNAPYLYIVTASNSGGGTVRGFVKRLDTGQVWTESISALGTGSGGTGTFTVGGRDSTSGRMINGPVACSMMSTKFLSLFELHQWAKDPWSFWYPTANRPEYAELGSTPPPSSSFYAWLMQSNYPVLGTGNF